MAIRSVEVSARARRVWQRLGEWYGARLSEQFGPEPPHDWCRLVDRSSNTDIQRALATVRSKHVSHPPTLPEFDLALQPQAPPHREPNAATVQERLVAYIVKRHHPLSKEQLIAQWTFLYERAQWVDALKRNRDERAACVGVYIPATHDRHAMRVMVSDMQADGGA